jgi:hypothetical protein
MIHIDSSLALIRDEGSIGGDGVLRHYDDYEKGKATPLGISGMFTLRLAWWCSV